MRLLSTDSERLSRILGDRPERSSLFLIMEVTLDRFIELTAERDDLLLQLNDYKL